ncbi:MAG: hypothetical protein V4548_11200 [Bacteroidota bacterium]
MLKIFFKELPKWFKILNASILLPILLWPIAFFMSIFLLDSPNASDEMFLAFFAMNMYPFFIIGIA